MVNVKYVRKETISISNVRGMCIKHNFYTHGDCRAYENMFKMCGEYDGTDEKLAHIAWDIVEHSDMEELQDYGFDSVFEIVAWVMTLLIQDTMCIRYEVMEVEE